MLYLISIGLSKNNISIGAIESIKVCTKIYLENYTNLYPNSIEEIESIFKKKIIVLQREGVENNSSMLIEEAKKTDNKKGVEIKTRPGLNLAYIIFFLSVEILSMVHF